MAKYEYTSVDMKYVLENPEEYIIPECLVACKILWEKGIDTVQCSNNEERETTYWIEIDERTLSEENKKYVYKMLDSKNPEFGEDIRFHHPVIISKRTKEGIIRLNELADSFAIQDTCRFVDNASILDSYKRRGGKLYIANDGSIHSDYNPDKVNATLEDALNELDLTYYSGFEGKLFLDKHGFDIHVNYQNNLQKAREKFVKTLKIIKK